MKSGVHVVPWMWAVLCERCGLVGMATSDHREAVNAHRRHARKCPRKPEGRA